MLFWFVAALLTLGASLAVLLPLSRRGVVGQVDGDHDIEVYRDQLAEIDRDAGRGLIGAPEAEQARAEIARRIIRTGNDRPRGGVSVGQSAVLRAVGAAAVLAVPLVSWGIYAATGSPNLPSQPLQERLAKNPAENSIEELIARAEGHLAANPADARGWEVLAPIYLRTGRSADAVNAYRSAMRIGGPTAAREAGLGEAIATAAGGLVSAEARAGFERALALEPNHPKAKFYLATALAQEGRLAEAVSGWTAMMQSLPADSPWRDAVSRSLDEARSRLAAAPGPGAMPGPNQAQVDAAAGMSETDRTAMIEGMVANLDQKLRDNPVDPEGWTRLVRSYLVLGRTEDARDAVSRGIEALGAGSEDGKRFAAFSASLNLPPEETAQ